MLTDGGWGGGCSKMTLGLKKSFNIRKGRMYVLNEKLDLWPLAGLVQHD